MKLLLLALMAVSMPTQVNLNFTSDSVYVNDNILTVTVQEEVDSTKSLIIEENYIMGYEIYDDKETPYIDGLKFDGEWVPSDWKIANYDDSIEHTFNIATVYTDDVAGMLASAKDGNISALLSNPVTLLQLVYYLLAGFSIVLGGFGLLKSKGKKLKTSQELAAAIGEQASLAKENLTSAAIGMINDIVNPVMAKLNTQNQAILEALVLARSGKSEDTLALVDLLKKSASEDISILTEQVKKNIKDAERTSNALKQTALETIKEISEEAKPQASKPTVDDGTSI